MKKIFIFLLALNTFSLVYSQANDSLVQFNFKVAIDDKSNPTLTINVSPISGWYVYQQNSIEGLENILINIDSSWFSPKENLKFIGTTIETINDPIFSKAKVIKKPFTIEQSYVNKAQASVFSGTINFSISNGQGFFYQINKEFSVTISGTGDKNLQFSQELILKNIQNPKANCGGTGNTKNSTLLTIFILGFLGGLLALLTPCVFPMLPITVSFFTKKSENKAQAIKNGVIYGLFIFGFYVLASLPFHIIGNVEPELFNNIATNAWLNLSFFVIFIFFAISFFGYFEITLPSGLASKVDNKKGLGSIAGIFFMALTLVIVSFSCTGPILGTLLVGSLTEGAWPLTMGLAGFGLALALPFGLFSVFPNYLKNLPRSGSWLDSVKKILAFIELALALKFLSNADLVKHWGLLKRETFIVIWLLILLGLILYLLGKIKLPHDTPEKSIPVWKKIVVLVVSVFTLYVFSGLLHWSNLSLLSGFPPPTNYSLFHKEQNNQNHIINDYKKALELAKKEQKILLLDFTGWACVNCRKMEENVWTDPEVAKFMSEKCIVASLYVDDKTKLPIDQQFVFTNSTNLTKKVITQGDKWTIFESENFKQVTQPLYVLLNGNEELLNLPISYTPNPSDYLKWLECGLQQQ